MIAAASCTPSAPEAPDLKIVLGQRVGPVDASTTREKLVALYGADNLADTDYPIGEGETVPGTIIFPGTSREATVLWMDGAAGQTIDRVVISGEEWLLPDGIRHGDELDAVEHLPQGEDRLRTIASAIVPGSDGAIDAVIEVNELRTELRF